MRLKTAIALIAASLFSTPALADHYEFDKEHTHVIFLINHLGFSTMMGLFTTYNGSFDFDEAHPENSEVDVTLKPNGIRTSSEKLDIELRGENFFNTEKYPEIHFVGKKVTVTGKNTGDVLGDVTMLGVTKPVTLHVTFNKADYQPIVNMYKAGFDATATFKRSDFGMTYGIPMVGDDVTIEISVEGVDQDRKKAEAIKH